MIQTNNKFSLSREDAAEKLKVSLRTVDRYLKTGKLGHVKLEEEGVLRVFVNEEEIMELINRKQKRKTEQGSDDSLKSEAENANSGQGSLVGQKAPENEKNANSGVNDGVAEVYRRLYEETNQRLGEANRRLEGANYRVGELEAQLKTSVPLLEYREAQDKAQKLSEKADKLNQEVAEGAVVNYRLTGEISEIRRNLDLEKSKKLFYIALLAVLIVLGSFGIFWQTIA